jgi:hypothetical protein
MICSELLQLPLESGDFHHRGLVPGPDESEEAFTVRAEASQTSHSCWKDLDSDVRAVCGAVPDWVEITYSNRGLPFWQGAVTTIEGSGISLQFRSAFEKGSYLGLYSRDEVAMHEAVHAIRMAFHEPKFEELLAYRTSKNRMRRFLGPIFFRSWESGFFSATLLLAALLQFWLPVAMAIPALIAVYGIVRLLRAQRILAQCLQRVPFALAVRLTDREIIEFSRSTHAEIERYAQEQSLTYLRWRQLYPVYFGGI